MKSKWYEYKTKARELRSKGWSIKTIQKELGIPISTLSGWLRDVSLTDIQKKILKEKWHQALIDARAKAVLWHNEQKRLRLEQAKQEAINTLSKIDVNDTSILNLALAFLYLEEGFKGGDLGIGNSDPVILKFFISVLKCTYGIDFFRISCELHLRADQSADDVKEFWSNELHIPISNFKKVYFDNRTKGSVTYARYKGVCVIRLGNVAIQRKLVYLGNLYCKEIIDRHLGD